MREWKNNYEFIDVYESLGRKDFHGLLNLNNTLSSKRVCYVGNSSAGIKETPALKCPAVIIGNRQHGRLHSTNVLFSQIDEDDILKNIEHIFENEEFINKCKESANPYGNGTMAKQSLKIIENLDLNKQLLKKTFIDL